MKAGGEGDDRGWDGLMASLTQWTWVWASYGRWWRTGKSLVLQAMGSQRVRHDWATEQQLVFQWCFKNFLCKVSHHLQIVTVLLLFQFAFLLFLFLLWLSRLRLPKLCWIRIVRVDTLILLLLLEKMLSGFHSWEWCFLWTWLIRPLLCCGRFPP